MYVSMDYNGFSLSLARRMCVVRGVGWRGLATCQLCEAVLATAQQVLICLCVCVCVCACAHGGWWPDVT